MTPKMRWERDTAQFSNGWLGKVGKWTVFNLYWSGSQGKDAKGKPAPYSLRCLLPGIKDLLGCFKTETLGKRRAREVFEHWFDGLRK